MIKMGDENKTIGISSLISAGFILMAMVIPGFFDDPQYYCEAESSIMQCPGDLSGGTATRCYLNEEKTSWDYCKGGWVEVTDDRPVQEKPQSSHEGVWGQSFLVKSGEQPVALD